MKLGCKGRTAQTAGQMLQFYELRTMLVGNSAARKQSPHVEKCCDTAREEERDAAGRKEAATLRLGDNVWKEEFWRAKRGAGGGGGVESESSAGGD